MLAESKIMGFLFTRDYDNARGFYEGKLGFQFVSEDQFALAVRAGSNMIRISKIPDFKPAQGTVLGWEVQDIEAAVVWLKGRGVALEDDLWLLAGGWHGDSLSRCHAHRTPKRSYAHVRLGEPLPQAGCLVDGRPRDVGEIGGALERDEPVAAVGIPAGTCGLVSWAARGPDACCEGL